MALKNVMRVDKGNVIRTGGGSGSSVVGLIKTNLFAGQVNYDSSEDVYKGAVVSDVNVFDNNTAPALIGIDVSYAIKLSSDVIREFDIGHAEFDPQYLINKGFREADSETAIQAVVEIPVPRVNYNGAATSTVKGSRLTGYINFNTNGSDIESHVYSAVLAGLYIEPSVKVMDSGTQQEEWVDDISADSSLYVRVYKLTYASSGGGGGSSALSDLEDVNLDHPRNRQVLTYDSASQKWLNANVPDELPSYSSVESGKFLGVNSSGNLAWTAAGGGGSYTVEFSKTSQSCMIVSLNDFFWWDWSTNSLTISDAYMVLEIGTSRTLPDQEIDIDVPKFTWKVPIPLESIQRAIEAAIADPSILPAVHVTSAPVYVDFTYTDEMSQQNTFSNWMIWDIGFHITSSGTVSLDGSAFKMVYDPTYGIYSDYAGIFDMVDYTSKLTLKTK